MNAEEDHKLLIRFLAHSIEHISSEIEHLNNSVKSLDKVSRDRILGNFGPVTELCRSFNRVLYAKGERQSIGDR